MKTATKRLSAGVLVAAAFVFAASAAAQSPIEGKWKISGYNFADKREFPLDKLEVTLTVGRDMHIGGRSACNLYSGSISLGPGNAIKLSAITSTEMACREIPGSFEGGFLDVLSNASRYDVKSGILTITDTSTGHFLRFVRADMPAPHPTPAPEPEVHGLHEILFVGNKMSKCTGIEPLKCMRIKSEKSGGWQDYHDSIVGFEPRRGRFYKIEVEQMGDPRSARPGIFRLKLVQVLKTSAREKDIYR